MATSMPEIILREDKHWRAAMEPVIAAVAREFGIVPQVIVDSTMLPVPRQARQVCYWLARRLRLRLTDREIYRALGRKSVIIQRNVDVIDGLRETDEWLKSTTNRLLAELQAA